MSGGEAAARIGQCARCRAITFASVLERRATSRYGGAVSMASDIAMTDAAGHSDEGPGCQEALVRKAER
ncbi:hypothetical protein CA984_00505 [Streptosporangium minutum]|uniref:Uncharacterized protein n=1 Tax=Streptosporangium minutum TaxID=569862 RepID=A0A243RXT1_9ACTN|nr:hypothetical protein CA984_00505 [Streptosporangium minutum]